MSGWVCSCKKKVCDLGQIILYVRSAIAFHKRFELCQILQYRLDLSETFQKNDLPIRMISNLQKSNTVSILHNTYTEQVHAIILANNIKKICSNYERTTSIVVNESSESGMFCIYNMLHAVYTHWTCKHNR